MQPPQPGILLVDDETGIREVISQALAIHGLPVTAVGTGLDFYRELNRQTFAVALIDLGLPDLTGYELVTYLRQNTSIRIIIVSSRDAIADRVNGYDAGADLYLVKPVSINELASAIKSLAGRGAASVTPVVTAWRLERITWRLLCPDGYEFSLVQKEYQVLAELAAAQGAPVKRDTLLNVVYDRADSAASRALDVLLSRVRNRFKEETGGVLPLVTIPRVGLHFSMPLNVI